MNIIFTYYSNHLRIDYDQIRNKKKLADIRNLRFWDLEYTGSILAPNLNISQNHMFQNELSFNIILRTDLIMKVVKVIFYIDNSTSEQHINFNRNLLNTELILNLKLYIDTTNFIVIHN